MAGIREYIRDRRWVAVHEAGHVIAARHFGADADGKIWPVDDRWTGGTEVPAIDAMPVEQRRVIGLAGAAALMLWLGLPTKTFFSLNVGMSKSDWELVGNVSNRKIAETLVCALEILERDRDELHGVARNIIVGSRR